MATMSHFLYGHHAEFASVFVHICEISYNDTAISFIIGLKSLYYCKYSTGQKRSSPVNFSKYDNLPYNIEIVDDNDVISAYLYKGRSKSS